MHDATRWPPAHRPEAYSQECVEGNSTNFAITEF
jgi:hypothetical protein